LLLSLSCSTGFNHCLIRNSDSCLIHNSSPRCFRHALVYRMTPFPVLTRPHWGAALSLASISCRTRMLVFSWFATCLLSNGFLIHSSLLAFSWATLRHRAESNCANCFRSRASSEVSLQEIPMECPSRRTTMRGRRILFDLYEMPSAGRCQSRLAPPTPC
jgi:hypothetical protein